MTRSHAMLTYSIAISMPFRSSGHTDWARHRERTTISGRQPLVGKHHHRAPTLLTPPLRSSIRPPNHIEPLQPRLGGSVLRLLLHLLWLRAPEARETVLLAVGEVAHVVRPVEDAALEAHPSAHLVAAALGLAVLVAVGLQQLQAADAGQLDGRL